MARSAGSSTSLAAASASPSAAPFLSVSEWVGLVPWALAVRRATASMPWLGSGVNRTSATTSAHFDSSPSVSVGRRRRAASAGEVTRQVPPERTNGASARPARLFKRRSISSRDRPVSLSITVMSPSAFVHEPTRTSGARIAA
ncbi:hypothetical protein ACFPRL_04865 [Pseudoclavibacter helvolus]